MTAFILLYLAMVRTAAGQRLDEAAMLLVAQALGTRSWPEVTLREVSVPGMLLATGLVVIATTVLRGGRRAMIAAGAAGLVFAGAELLKLFLQRPAMMGEMAANSFPSGHVAAVAGLGVCLVVAVPKAARGLVALLAMGPATALTGLATVVLHWHRPSDVAGSILLALGIGAVAVFVADAPTTRARGTSRTP